MLRTRATTQVAATSAALVLALVAAWFLLLDPVRAEAAELRAATADAAASNAQLEAELVELQAQFIDLPTQHARLEQLRAQLPEAAELPSLVGELQDAASGAGVVLDTIAPGTAALVVPDPAAGSAGAPAGLVEIPVTVVTTGSFAQQTDYLRRVQTQLRRSLLVSGLDMAVAVPDDPTGRGAAPASGLVTATTTGSVFVLPSPDPVAP